MSMASLAHSCMKSKTSNKSNEIFITEMKHETWRNVVTKKKQKNALKSKIIHSTLYCIKWNHTNTQTKHYQAKRFVFHNLRWQQW